MKQGLCYRHWRHSDGRGELIMLHSEVRAGYFGATKTLTKLHIVFYWLGCRHDVELFVHCCAACTIKKGPIGQSQVPMQPYVAGAPTERVGVDILGPLSKTELGNCYMLVTMD